MDAYKPCAGEVDEVMQLICICDTVDGCVQSQEEEKDVGDVSPPNISLS